MNGDYTDWIKWGKTMDYKNSSLPLSRAHAHIQFSVVETNRKAQSKRLSWTNIIRGKGFRLLIELLCVAGRGHKEWESREGRRTAGRGSAAYPLLVVEGADGDLLLLAARGAPTVQPKVPRGLCADLHGRNQASVISRQGWERSAVENAGLFILASVFPY